MVNLIPWLLFAIAIISMSTLIGILLWYTGLTESQRYQEPDGRGIHTSCCNDWGCYGCEHDPNDEPCIECHDI